MKQNVYEVEKNVEKILRKSSTGFLTKNIRIEVEKNLKKQFFNVFEPFKDAEKVILYSNKMPVVRLFKLECYKKDALKHSTIMGSLFGVNIASEMFGDIVRWKQDFYVYLLDEICELVINEFRMVGNIPVSLKEVSLNLLDNFEREYEEIELIVSSLRIDTIIARLIGCNRECVGDKIKNQEIFLNESIVRKASILLNNDDLFSIRRYGKFCFVSLKGFTKKNNYIVLIKKYI